MGFGPDLLVYDLDYPVFGNGAVAVFLIRDPDLVRSVYPYPDQDSESGSMRAKLTHQKKLRNFMF